MAGRFVALLTMTLLFMRLWNANHASGRPTSGILLLKSVQVGELLLDETASEQPGAQPKMPATALSENDRHALGTAHVSGADSASAPSAEKGASVSVAPVRMRVSLWVEPRELPEQFPAGITVGTFQVIDNLGHVTLVEISARQLALAGITPQLPCRDLYTQQEGNQRWYFIRLGDLANAQMTLPPQSAPRKSLALITPGQSAFQLPLDSQNSPRDLPPVADMSAGAMAQVNLIQRMADLILGGASPMWNYWRQRAEPVSEMPRSLPSDAVAPAAEQEVELPSVPLQLARPMREAGLLRK